MTTPSRSKYGVQYSISFIFLPLLWLLVDRRVNICRDFSNTILSERTYFLIRCPVCQIRSITEWYRNYVYKKYIFNLVFRTDNLKKIRYSLFITQNFINLFLSQISKLLITIFFYWLLFNCDSYNDLPLCIDNTM